jgi:hypothetical protein
MPTHLNKRGIISECLAVYSEEITYKHQAEQSETLLEHSDDKPIGWIKTGGQRISFILRLF